MCVEKRHGFINSQHVYQDLIFALSLKFEKIFFGTMERIFSKLKNCMKYLELALTKKLHLYL